MSVAVLTLNGHDSYKRKLCYLKMHFIVAVLTLNGHDSYLFLAQHESIRGEWSQSSL